MTLFSATTHALPPNTVPEGPALRQGDAVIARDARGLQIVQTGSHAIIDWRSFDIGGRAAVHVMQTSSGATLLNRVTGATASEIAGNLTANGRVFLINPNGIDLTSTSTVAAAAFVASTLDIADHDFMAGAWHFGATAPPVSGLIAQAGEINIDHGGFAVLLGHRIAHSGTIRTPLGHTALVAGARATLMPDAHTFLRVTRSARVDADLPGDGPAAIHSCGIITAHGGLALSSPTPHAAPDQASNATRGSRGAAGARRVVAHPGAILIDGGAGTVRLSGTLDASSNIAGDGRESGGTVNILGSRVVMDGPTIDVCGTRGSGRVRLASGTIEGQETIHWSQPLQLTVAGSGPVPVSPAPSALPSPPSSSSSSSSPISPASPPSPSSSPIFRASPPLPPILRPLASPLSLSPFSLPSAVLRQPAAVPSPMSSAPSSAI
ncbi:MAG: filamentous hemagglutinin N-terminal domain-containing protein [Janthinobacterium lividum]